MIVNFELLGVDFRPLVFDFGHPVVDVGHLGFDLRPLIGVDYSLRDEFKLHGFNFRLLAFDL